MSPAPIGDGRRVSSNETGEVGRTESSTWRELGQGPREDRGERGETVEDMLSAWHMAQDSGFLWHDSVSSQMSFHSSPSSAFVVSLSLLGSRGR